MLRQLFRLVLLAGVTVFASSVCLGQAYSLQGTTLAFGNDCYRITEDVQWQNGTIWYTRKLNLKASFDIEFTMNFGTKDDAGADGMMFVLQDRGSNAIGQVGQGMGFKDFSPSLGVEFDTYENPYEVDPPYDHVAIVSNGSVDHESRYNLAGPVQALADHPNIEDGADHLVRIRWKAPQNRLEVYIDCSKRLSARVDMASIFGPVTEVFWGFTGATGGSSNRQSVCLKKEIVVQDTLSACQGDVVQLVARTSLNGQYKWAPASLLSDPGIRTPTARLNRSQLFTVDYLDFCNQTVRDSVYVEVEQQPSLDLGDDRIECGKELILGPRQAGANAKYLWSTGATTSSISIDASGTYSLAIHAGQCVWTDTVNINFRPAPELPPAYAPAILCMPNGPLTLASVAAGRGLTYAWAHSSETSGSVQVSQKGTYEVTVIHESGCEVTETFLVESDCVVPLWVPEAFSPNADGENDQLTFYSPQSMEVRFWVYNRWGEVIFFTNDPNRLWDGTFGGSPCSPGTYVWRAEYRAGSQTSFSVKTGRVWLIR